MKKVKNSNLLSLLNVSIALLVLSIVFYYFHLKMMSVSSDTPVMSIIESNPIFGSDLLAVCGKIFTAAILLKLRLKIKSDEDESYTGLTFLLLAASQILIQNYIVALMLLYISYLRYFPLKREDIFSGNLKKNIASFALLGLHILILFVNLRIQAIV
ncbi:hypothetical protein [Desnuesiella massiliensis]|uniref:hypothetical protein n=1 Tax=Desnuesiella massiliensis TaxID=1650662 RepID=UPI0006E37C1B|nr:hypothetical protein [Desnuesiella massiliensis]